MTGPRAIALAAAALAASVALAAGEPVVIATASSLREVARDAASALAPGLGEDAFAIQAAGTGVLARQIERGSPARAILAASAEDLDALAREGLLDTTSRRDLASNALVLVAPRGSSAPSSLADLAGPRFRRVALANPRTAPAGRYALEALEAAGVPEAVLRRAVYGENVRQVLEYVARGDADAGVVYRSDVAAFPDRVAVGGEVPASLHRPIRIQGALLAGDADPRAEALLRWLASPAGRDAFARRGFGPP